MISLGYDYWALGHIHKRSVANENPHIVMPGIPQGRDIGESGPKSATFVEVSNGKANVEEFATAKAEFDYVSAEATGISNWDKLLGVLVEALSEAKQKASAPNLVARVAVKGKSPLHWRIRHSKDILFEHLEDEVSAIGGVWIEKIEIMTTPETSEVESGDPIDELLVHMRGLSSDTSFRKQAFMEWESLLKQLPREIRADWGGMQPDEVNDLLRRLIAEGGEDIAASLRPEGALQ